MKSGVKMPETWKNEDYVKRYNKLYGITEEQVKRYLAPLKLNNSDVAIEFGCGNCGIIARIADSVKTVVGVDLSKTQLEIASKNLANNKNVILIESNFLDCDISKYSFTKGFSRKALHHLTDPEKEKFALKIAPHFKKDSIFVIEDGIFNFDKSLLNEKVPEIVKEAKVYYGANWPGIEKDFMITILEEFVTDYATWENAFAKGGFKMIEKTPYSMFYGMAVFQKQ